MLVEDPTWSYVNVPTAADADAARAGSGLMSGSALTHTDDGFMQHDSGTGSSAPARRRG